MLKLKILSLGNIYYAVTSTLQKLILEQTNLGFRFSIVDVRTVQKAVHSYTRTVSNKQKLANLS